MISFKPKDDTFFDYFIKGAENCRRAALALDNLVNDYTDIEVKIQKIKDIEHDNDKIVHEITARLKKSFITPIDREDIYILTNQIDSVIDSIEETAFRLYLLNISNITPQIKDLSDKLIQATDKLPKLMEGLKELKYTDNLRQTIIEINSIEDLGDQIFRKSVSEVFRSDLDGFEKMRLKEIYEFFEDSIDSCEDVSDKTEEVIMKHA